MFLICQRLEHRLLTYPRLSNIPHESADVPPKQLRFSFETPTTPQRLHLTLQALSITHTNADYFLHISLDVHPRTRNLVQVKEGKKVAPAMSIKAFNQNTGMNLSKSDLKDLKLLHEELKRVEKEERELYLKGMDKGPELLATRKFIESEIDKWARKIKSSNGSSPQPPIRTSNGIVRPKERELRGRVALKTLSLKGMEVLVPEALNGALGETRAVSDDQDQGEEAEHQS